MGKSPQTAFQKIAHFNTLIGNSNAADLSGLLAQFHCIKEEFLEMEHALNAYITQVQATPTDFGIESGHHEKALAAYRNELRDGIADVLVTTYGLAHRAGIDADFDLDLVYESNMSKFIKTSAPGSEGEKEVWSQVMEVTSRLGLDCKAAETAPGIWAITSAKDQEGCDGRFYPEGKLLKPAQFREPDFSKLRQGKYGTIAQD